MFTLYWIALVAFQFLYWIGFLFLLNYSLFNIIIASDRVAAKTLRSDPFQKYVILNDFFDFKVYSLTSKPITIHTSFYTYYILVPY